MTYTFSFDAKQGNLAAPTTASAFIQVIKTSDGTFADLGTSFIDTTALGTNWTSAEISLGINAAMAGETLQIGFLNTASNFSPSGNFYDYVSVSAIPEPSSRAAFAFGSFVLVSRRRRRRI